MKVVVTAATQGEWMPAASSIKPLYTKESKRLNVSFHCSGVGMLASCFALTKLVYEQKPDLIVQIGIAGCFDHSVSLGKVIAIGDETLADTGVEENGQWKDLFDLKLTKSNEAPFNKKLLSNPYLADFNLLKLPVANGITVNEVTTHPQRIQQFYKKYHPIIESMEGAALHYVGLQMQVPFLQIRALSNYIGERDKAKWVIKEAITNVNQSLLKYIDKLYKIS